MTGLDVCKFNCVFKNALGRVKPSDSEENSEFVPNLPDLYQRMKL